MKCRTTRGVLSGLLVYFGILMLLVMAACTKTPPASSSQSVSQVKTEQTTHKDSTHVEEKLVEQKVVVPGDSSRIQVQVQVNPSTGELEPIKASAGGKRSKAHLEMDRTGQLTASCECEEENLLLQYVQKQIYRLQEEITRQASAIESEEVKVPDPVVITTTAWYDQIARWLASLLLIICLFKLIRYLIKQYPYVKIFRK